MSIISKAKVWQGKNQIKDGLTNHFTTLQPKDCCSNQTFFKERDDIFKRPNTILENVTLVFITTFSHNYNNTFEGTDRNVIPL